MTDDRFPITSTIDQVLRGRGVSRLTRRRFLLNGLLGLGAALGAEELLAACGGGGTPGAQGPTNLGVLSYGGPVAQVERQLVVPHLKQRDQISATLTENTVIAPTIASQGQHPKYDLFTENVLFLPKYPQIFSKVTESDVPNLKNVYPSLVKAGQGELVPAWIQSETIVYREDKFSREPTLEDFLNPKYKGRIAVQATPFIAIVAPLMFKQLGGSLNDPEPIFRWWKKMVPNLLTAYTQVTQPAQMFQNNEIDLAIWYSGRAAQLRNTAHVPIKWVKDPAIAVIIGMTPAKGGQNIQGAYRYIDRWLDPEVQGKMATTAWFGPVTQNASIPADAAKKLPIYGASDIAGLLQPDWKALTPHLSDWEARFVSVLQQYGPH